GIAVEFTGEIPDEEGIPLSLSLMLGIVFAAFAGAAAFFRIRAGGERQDYGMTTLIAAYATFALGLLAVIGDMVIAAASAVAVTTLLGLKQPLHRWIAAFTEDEILAALKLLVMSLVLLPVLPNRDMGPWAAINPYELWLMVILIAGISFIGYIAIKLIGERKGILVTALAGGLVSSTAVTMDLAGRARRMPAQRRLLATGIGLATLTMFVRVFGVVAVIEPSLLVLLWPIIGAAVLCCGAVALLLWPWGTRPEAVDQPTAVNPLELGTALKFGALLGAILIATKVAQLYLGTAGVYGLALASGLADVDAATLSFAKATRVELAATVAATAITLLILSNTFSKLIIAISLGGRRSGPILMLPLIVPLFVGTIILLVTSFPLTGQ
ncbi:MAG: MgtC/SapB family protein, partial [Geminicoccaceae bacterium]